MIDQSVEGVEGEFSQAVGRVLEGFEEVLVSGFPGLGFFDLCGELVDAGLEFVVPVGEVIVALLVGALVESCPGVLSYILLDGVCNDLSLVHEPVAFGFQLVGFEEERQHLLAVGDDLGFCFEELVHRRQECGLYFAVVYGWCGAFLPDIVFVVAAPYGFPVFAVGMPDLGAVERAALPASDFAGEDVDAAVVHNAVAAFLHLALDQVEGLRCDDRFMVAFHVVLRDFALVDLRLFREVVDCVGFLQQGVALVFLVSEDGLDGTDAPVILAAGCLDAVIGKLLGDAVVGQALQEEPVDAADGFCLLWVDDELAIRTAVVAEKPVERNRHLAVCESLTLSPGAVLGNAPGFLLRKARHDGDQQFSFAVEGPDVLLLEVAFDAVFLELSDGCQAVDGVSGESADALGDDQVDLPGKRVLDHVLESDTFLDAGSADSLVRVDIHEFPVITAFDVIGVVIDLRLVARELVVMVC